MTIIADPLTGRLWTVLNWVIQQKFPQAPSISTDELATWLNQSDRPKPVLLDVRTADEFEVSHLLGARRLDPDTEDVAALCLATATPIVTYCSVGYRSARMAERLMAAGLTSVANLEGSIFKWANEGKPVYQNGQVVSQVHPYNPFWGQLLKAPFHADR